MLILSIIFFISSIEIQTDWVSGTGCLGPASHCGAKFYNSDSITYNVQGQISPISTQVDYNGWVKHIIDTSAGITENSILAADFDNDKDLDLVGNIGNIVVFYENNNNNFTPVDSIVLGAGFGKKWAFMDINDLNNDGFIDVVVPCGESGGGLAWLENQGNFHFITHIIAPASANSRIFTETGDINGDGYIDIINTSSSITLEGVHVWINNGVGVFTNVQNFCNTNCWRVRLDDFNRDSTLDIVAGSIDVHAYYLYFNDGTGFFNYIGGVTFPGDFMGDGLWTRDFDNDGDEDILWGAINNRGDSSFLCWSENDGTGANYTNHIVHIDSSVWGPYGDGVCAEDMDLDGKADVVGGFSKLAFFRQINSDSFVLYPIDNLIDCTHWIIPVEFNKCDENVGVDILVCQRGAFLWYENKMIKKFAGTAWLESSILTANKGVQWKYFGYDLCCPFDSAISFQFKSGKNVADITGKTWSLPIPVIQGTTIDSINLTSYTTNGDTLFQYRANFTGKDSGTGVIYSVWVKFDDVMSTEEKTATNKVNMQVINDKIYYYLPENLNISLSIYDIDGRLVKILERGKKQTGNYCIKIPRLASSGVYFASLRTERGNIKRKLIYIK